MEKAEKIKVTKMILLLTSLCMTSVLAVQQCGATARDDARNAAYSAPISVKNPST